jgi:hypothetical protein
MYVSDMNSIIEDSLVRIYHILVQIDTYLCYSFCSTVKQCSPNLSSPRLAGETTTEKQAFDKRHMLGVFEKPVVKSNGRLVGNFSNSKIESVVWSPDFLGALNSGEPCFTLLL